MTLVGRGSARDSLSEREIETIVDEFVATLDLDGKRLVLLVPDGTRSAPIPLMLRLLHGRLAGRAAAVDVLVALGTHQPMDDAALDRLVGASAAGRAADLPAMTVINHEWWRLEAYATIGTISAAEVAQLSEGRLEAPVDVRINRLVVDADIALVVGPVFPHEVVGFSGGNKYFFPGVSGPELIDLSHWLGALITSHGIIGTRGTTPVRAVIDHAAAMIPTPRYCLAMVVQSGSHRLHALFGGTPEEAWAAAADVSAQTHIRYVDRPYQTVLSVIPSRYEDMWTAAKGMYKVEPVVADGGEVIIYAPHIKQFSATHGAVLAEVGYHTRDYFLSQWDRFQGYPLGILAHSTHLRGAGSYADDVETPRIAVTLATAIPPDVCAAHGLGYRDPATVDLRTWLARDDPDVLVVENAGETLYRLRGTAAP